MGGCVASPGLRTTRFACAAPPRAGIQPALGPFGPAARLITIFWDAVLSIDDPARIFPHWSERPRPSRPASSLLAQRGHHAPRPRGRDPHQGLHHPHRVSRFFRRALRPARRAGPGTYETYLFSPNATQGNQRKSRPLCHQRVLAYHGEMSLREKTVVNNEWSMVSTGCAFLVAPGTQAIAGWHKTRRLSSRYCYAGFTPTEPG